MKKKIATILGTRPQLIKASVLSALFQEEENLQEVIVHTGQHYDTLLSRIFVDELSLPAPHYNLRVGSDTALHQIGKMLSACEAPLVSENPDLVLVYGDTNSALCGALAAEKLQIPVAHVEAGLRSFNRRMPEEINRILTDRISAILFAPTDVATENLKKEGFAGKNIHQVGDIMHDAALRFGKKAQITSKILETLELRPRTYVLLTIHRAENTDDEKRLTNIVFALEELSKSKTVLFPVHPRTKNALVKLNLWERIGSCIVVTDPVGYLDMIMLEMNAELIVTDSGGVQKEAFFYSVPCVTLRDETEWTELVDLGWNTLVSPDDRERILPVIESSFNRYGQVGSPYGTGDTAQQILDVIKDFLGIKNSFVRRFL